MITKTALRTISRSLSKSTDKLHARTAGIISKILYMIYLSFDCNLSDLSSYWR